MILKGKNIVITGSGRGIGKHIALLCAKEGANIGLMSRTENELINIKKEIDNLGTGVKVAIKTGDIALYKDVENIFEGFHNELGQLNGVIANAGWRDSQPSPTYDLEVFRKILDVNILGVYYTFRAAYPFLKMDDKKDKARFIVTGSQHYRTPAAKFLPYTIAKYGAIGLIHSLSIEFRRDNITFNAVMPTIVDTYLHRGANAEDGNKPNNFLNPWDISDYYLYFLSGYANRSNFELLFTLDFENVKELIREASTDKKENLDAFLGYIEELKPKLFEKVNKLTKFIEFLLARNK